MEIEQARILILEDSDSDYLVLRQMLLENGVQKDHIRWTKSLKDFRYDGEQFVLCDLNVIDSHGIDTLKAVLDILPELTASVIAFTGEDDELLAQEAIHIGVQDYLIKGSFGKAFLRKTLIFAQERTKLLRNLFQQEQRTREVEQYLDAIISTAPSIILRFDQDFTIEYLNKGFDTKTPKEDLLGTSLLDFIVEEEREQVRTELTELREVGRAISLQTIARDTMGNTHEMLFRVSGLSDGGYVLIATDVSDLMEARRLVEKESARGKLFQLQLLSSQLNPHFVFNAMSSIQHSVLLNNVEDTLAFISRFSSLMRQVLENSRKELITWDEEEEFLTTFLDIERFRFEDRFDYSFNVPDEVDTEVLDVPPMMIQPYLENTVVHGVGNLKERRGLIQINLNRHGECIVVSIEDNGIGREKAKELRSLRVGGGHVSRAMSINEERIALLNSIYDTDLFRVEIEDLTDESGKARGTRVNLYIPESI